MSDTLRTEKMTRKEELEKIIADAHAEIERLDTPPIQKGTPCWVSDTNSTERKMVRVFLQYEQSQIKGTMYLEFYDEHGGTFGNGKKHWKYATPIIERPRLGLWLATDKDGIRHIFSNKPERGSREWLTPDDYFRYKNEYTTQLDHTWNDEPIEI